MSERSRDHEIGSDGGPGLQPAILGFGGHRLLSGLPQKYVEEMSALSRLIQFDAGQQLFKKGEEAKGFYLIREGSISIGISSSGGSVLIQTIGQGDMVGWSWLFPPYRWQFDAKAEKKTLAIRVDAVSMRRLCEEDHDLGYEMHRRISQVMFERLQATRLQLLDVLRPVAP